MNKNEWLTDAEWEVMRVVLAQERPTSRQIQLILQPKYGWAASTVKTLLKRLVDKGFLITEQEGKSFHYQATMSQQDLSVRMVQKSLNKLCTTKQAGVLMEVLKTVPLSVDDIKNLRDVLALREEDAVAEVRCHCLEGQCECQEDCHGKE